MIAGFEGNGILPYVETARQQIIVQVLSVL